MSLTDTKQETAKKLKNVDVGSAQAENAAGVTAVQVLEAETVAVDNELIKVLDTASMMITGGAPNQDWGVVPKKVAGTVQGGEPAVAVEDSVGVPDEVSHALIGVEAVQASNEVPNAPTGVDAMQAINEGPNPPTDADTMLELSKEIKVAVQPSDEAPQAIATEVIETPMQQSAQEIPVQKNSPTSKDPGTREKVKQERTHQESTEADGKSRIRIRLIPIWLRLVIIILLLSFSLMSGMMVGYGVIGDGKPFDALKQSTWTHIVDIINKEK
ncbi:DNA-directed RNA polymerase subunit beta [Neobacillus sp. LXY-4]|uniref:DNA-directed RNA polymerase subunit beta n=1 Tax=Neobacillus sp. LXY-4 TaxID=3379826 RepID=UPI003EE0D417